MDILLILFLILVNGAFAMSEMAVVSARKGKLQHMADAGSPGAASALALNHEPSHFLSTIQVGITSIGILNGAVGESALADPLAAWLGHIAWLAPHAKGVALTITVIALTYFSVIVGELVPKQLALLAPENIATMVSRPMMGFARAAHPLVALLAGSSALMLRVLGARRSSEPPVTDEEIKVLMEQGAEAGVFHESEQEIVSNVLRLDQMRIPAIMTPRPNMAVIDLEAGYETVRQAIASTAFSRLVVCRGGLDNIAGVLQTGDLLKKCLLGGRLDLAEVQAVLEPPLYVPRSATVTQLLENFRRSHLQFALIVDEYGDVQGLVTLTDVLAAIVGELTIPAAPEERDILPREDGSWLVNGDVSVDRLKARLGIDAALPGEEENAFHTLGGFIMGMLGRIPAPTDHFLVGGFRFEVIDMDGNRVDKVLVVKMTMVRSAEEDFAPAAGGVRRLR